MSIGGGSSSGISRSTIPSSSARNSSLGIASRASVEKLEEQRNLDPCFDPKKNNTVKSDGDIVFVLGADGTGSNEEVYARFFGDSFPTFIGNMFYLDSDKFQYLGNNVQATDICLIANGDSTTTKDRFPLQSSRFVKGGDAFMNLAEKVYMGGFHGGGNLRESYQNAWYHVLKNYDISSAKKAFYISFGDEATYDFVEPDEFFNLTGIKIARRIPTSEVIKDLMEKFGGNFYFLLNSYGNEGHDSYHSKKIRETWEELFAPYPGRLIIVQKGEEVTDDVIGVVALVTGVTLETYTKNMKARGQEEDRIANVAKSLSPTYEFLKTQNNFPVELPVLPINSFENFSSKSGAKRVKKD